MATIGPSSVSSAIYAGLHQQYHSGRGTRCCTPALRHVRRSRAIRACRPACLYQASQAGEHRGQLSARPALARGCTERVIGSDILGGISRHELAAAKRLRIAVDVDEVLGRFVYALNRYCKDVHDMDYDVEDYWVYEFAKIWGCTQERSNMIVHDFFTSSHFNDGIPIIPGALGSLTRLSTFADLVVVTSRQHVIQDATLSWIDAHYPGLFSEVYFGNHFALSGTSRKKSDICRSIGAHVLVDDNPGYAIDCAQAGIQVLLYDWQDSYPWSKLPPGAGHPNITVVRDWAEAEAAIRAMAVAP